MQKQKMKNKKVLTLLLTVAALATVATGCGKGKDAEKPAETEVTETVENNDTPQEKQVELTETENKMIEMISSLATKTAVPLMTTEITADTSPADAKKIVGLEDISMFDNITYAEVAPMAEDDVPAVFTMVLGKLQKGVSNAEELAEQMKEGLLETAPKRWEKQGVVPDEAEIAIKDDYILVILNDSKNKLDFDIKKISEDFLKGNTNSPTDVNKEDSEKDVIMDNTKLDESKDKETNAEVDKVEKDDKASGDKTADDKVADDKVADKPAEKPAE